ncbi:MAG: HAD family phosphatase [Clostridiales bacterium]|nr:HAD family phosphatase [Clostridiales bacterium]
MLKAVIFDMDGVLLDSESRHYAVLRTLMAEYGFTYTLDHFRRFCGVPETEMWPQLLAEAGMNADANDLYRKHWERYRRDLDTNGLPVFLGTAGFLKALKDRGYRLAVASASLLSVVEEYLERLGYRQYFDRVVSSQSCPHGKPEPDVFLLAAKELRVAPGECIVVEDSANGMIAARRAGMKLVGFNGAEVPADVSLAPFTFSDYRSMTPEQFEMWYEE